MHKINIKTPNKLTIVNDMGLYIRSFRAKRFIQIAGNGYVMYQITLTGTKIIITPSGYSKWSILPFFGPSAVDYYRTLTPPSGDGSEIAPE